MSAPPTRANSSATGSREVTSTLTPVAVLAPASRQPWMLCSRSASCTPPSHSAAPPLANAAAIARPKPWAAPVITTVLSTNLTCFLPSCSTCLRGAGVECITESVAEQVEPEHGQRDEDPGDRRDVGRLHDVVAAT